MVAEGEDQREEVAGFVAEAEARPRDLLVELRAQSLQIGGMENFLSISSDFTDDGRPKLFTSMMEEFETENRMAKRNVDKPRGMSVKWLGSEGVFVRPPISIFVDRDRSLRRWRREPSHVAREDSDTLGPVAIAQVTDFGSRGNATDAHCRRSGRVSKVGWNWRIGGRLREGRVCGGKPQLEHPLTNARLM